MASPLPPDPYAALGVPRDCDQSVIKATYKKLVLKTHPDKFTDEAVKKQKQEEFHKIQEAYEIIGDEEKRAQHDAEVKLQELRRERFSKPGSGGTRVEVHKTHYDVRTAAPSDPSFPQPRFEERKPTRTASYEDDRYYEDRSSSRKYDTYDSYPRRSPPRSSREKEPIKVTRVATDRLRSDNKKSRDKDDRRERSAKYFTSVEDDISSADDKLRFESATRQRERERRRQEEEEKIRRDAAEARRKAEKGRSTEDMRKADRERKYSDHLEHATNYIRHRAAEEPRPSPGRSSSSREPEHYSRRGSDAPRRSSARPKETVRPTSSGRDRDRKGIFPDIVEWEHESERKIPSLKPSVSSPPEIPGARIQVPPQRSYTEASSDRRRREVSPPQFLQRAETMPAVHTSSSRRKEPSSTRILDPSYATSAAPETIYPTIPPSTKKYYTASGGGVRLAPDDVEVANGHHAIRREPRHDSDRHRTRSPSPRGGMGRPPIGPNRVVAPKYVQVPAAPQPPRTSTIVPPFLGRSATMGIPSERDRGRKYFGEIDSDIPKRGRQASIDPTKVVYAHRIGRDDIRYSPMETKGDDYFRTIRKPEGFVY